MDRGAFYGDLTDIYGICIWYLEIMEHLMNSRSVNREMLEDVFVELDVQLLEHMRFHLKSQKKLLPQALRAVASSPRKNTKERRAVRSKI